ncbi:zinc ribbon-containing protein [Brenneria roseae subsp. americana]|uniref:Zinc ribbon-containing protein n=1 Tax=Brenneria roseae subsp. americana TaxID=1508507 RepID=A0A2U1U0P2_9GAMM|nr:zinc ribbon-containing protein [Brenneria roseae]PWC15182.1 zinc ribbon-containing protein [Brenneria roseae subsp. americana]
MNKVARYYRELMASVTARLNNGERDIDELVQSARKTLQESSELTQKEIEQVIQAVQRDLGEFALSYSESQEEFADSVFMRVIKESLWQELVDITDKTQLEWHQIFKDVNNHGVYHSGEVVGLGNLVCEKCHHHIAFYTPEILPLCPKCSHDLFHRQPFQP